MMDLKKLSDRELLARTQEVASREREITLELMHHLREVDRRDLFVELGYPSLYEYTVKELKISQGAAYRRVQTMRLLNELPLTEEKLADGRLTISTVSKVQSLMRKESPEKRQEMLNKLEGKSIREVERELASKRPQEAKEFVRWINMEEVQITFAIDRDCFQSLQELFSLRTHVDIKKTYRVIFRDLVELGQKTWNPLRRTKSPAPGTSRVMPEEGWKTVPPSLHHAIWTRDQGICTYRNPANGARCESRELLQIDHIHPLALGGKNELNNLRLLCAKHNRARAEKTYGPC